VYFPHGGHDVRSITLEIIQSSLQAISNEMFSSMRKTAMSSIIYEVLDMAPASADAEGNLAASGAGIPAFVAHARQGGEEDHRAERRGRRGRARDVLRDETIRTTVGSRT